jgi:methionine synthase II (cobalamin-independent)
LSITPKGVLAKMNIPSPVMLFKFDKKGITPDVYNGNKNEFMNDVVEAYSLSIKKFYDIGCRYL